jgi:cytosine/adenosine deaminase-related metal-dependent hydrolase
MLDARGSGAAVANQRFRKARNACNLPHGAARHPRLLHRRSLPGRSDGLVVCRKGRIEAAGSYDTLRSKLPADIPITDYSGCIISPGFIDTHIHYVQTGIIAAPGKQLLQWVNDYVYPVEEAFADETHARQVATIFCDALLRNGTTTAVVYCAVYSHCSLRGTRPTRYPSS